MMPELMALLFRPLIKHRPGVLVVVCSSAYK